MTVDLSISPRQNKRDLGGWRTWEPLNHPNPVLPAFIPLLTSASAQTVESLCTTEWAVIFYGKMGKTIAFNIAPVASYTVWMDGRVVVFWGLMAASIAPVAS